MKALFLSLLFLLTSLQGGQAQSFTNWIVGDTTDFVTNEYQSGLVLAGGSTDNDEAMQWMLQRAAGGDVVIIRASNSDGYNDYFYDELGVNVHSVETIRFDGLDAASDPYVIQRIRDAEVLFIAGGDQYDYYQYWKDNAIEEAINYLISEKGITVGGTSAGMAILGQAYYTPSGGSLDTDEALPNPFHPDFEILGNGDFVKHPLMTNTITDTHYDQRDRAGRHVAFLARLIHDYSIQPNGIASNEYTAVAIDESGKAQVFGYHPEYEDYAYFLKSNCQEDFGAEVIEANTPLTWNRGNRAVIVYKVPGTTNGGFTFDLNTWMTGEGGTWEHWYCENGQLSQVPAENGDCEEIIMVGTAEVSLNRLEAWPNPTVDQVVVRRGSGQGVDALQLWNMFGQLVRADVVGGTEYTVDLANLPVGIYRVGWGEAVVKIIKTN